MNWHPFLKFGLNDLFIHQVSFIPDSVLVMTCLEKSVFFIRHGWWKLTGSCHKILFQKWSSATETLVLVQKTYGNEALNRSNVLRWYSRFRDGGSW
jgi:hypothetical protein